MFVEDAVHSNHCGHGHHAIWGRFLDTVQFKCLDVATEYYPCTAAKVDFFSIKIYRYSFYGSLRLLHTF